jgi:hypothetical protein
LNKSIFFDSRGPGRLVKYFELVSVRLLEELHTNVSKLKLLQSTLRIISTSTWCSSSQKRIVTDTQDHNILASINFFGSHQEEKKKKVGRRLLLSYPDFCTEPGRPHQIYPDFRTDLGSKICNFYPDKNIPQAKISKFYPGSAPTP